METPPENGLHLPGASSRVARRLLVIFENRLELLAMEVQEERERLLHALLLALAVAVVSQMIRAPRRFLSALALTLRLTRSSDRPALWHFIYLAEACWIAPRLARQGIGHIHAHFGTNPAEVAMLASQLENISYSVTIHGPEEFDRAPSIHLGEKIRRAQVPDPVAVVLKGVVPRQPLPATAGTHCHADRSEAVAEPVADRGSRSPRLGRGQRAPGAVAPREIDGLTDRSVVHEHTPPAPPVAELEDRDLVDRPCKDAG